MCWRFIDLVSSNPDNGPFSDNNETRILRVIHLLHFIYIYKINIQKSQNTPGKPHLPLDRAALINMLSAMITVTLAPSLNESCYVIVFQSATNKGIGILHPPSSQ